VDIDGRLTCEWTSPEPKDPILGILEDPDEGSGVHQWVSLRGKKINYMIPMLRGK